jgi:antitoxin MazE
MVKKWGNSASVRIPAIIMQAAHLDLDQEVDIREEGGRVIIEPVHQVTYDLASLLDGITADNLHGEVSSGNAVGQEIW